VVQATTFSFDQNEKNHDEIQFMFVSQDSLYHVSLQSKSSTIHIQSTNVNEVRYFHLAIRLDFNFLFLFLNRHPKDFFMMILMTSSSFPLHQQLQEAKNFRD